MTESTIINISKLNNNDYKIYKPLAIFDLDHTIIKPKSNKKISTDSDDWIFFF